ncbi:MAG: DUF932 domain-containing protein, partial [Verrucomicrobiales bacterium]|nr:DUF932 domain-containing protein [Verrucomicrobiales bacterium]
LGYRIDQLARLHEPSLASQVLNDLISQSDVLDGLRRDQFVVDERSRTIIGLVSESYVTYSNEDFFQDVQSFLSDLALDDSFSFCEGFGINTELTIRFRSEKRHGVVKDARGEKTDRTDFGIELKNSMVGTSAVHISYFLNRLLCSNGMTVPTASSVGRVIHSGKRGSFNRRMEHCFFEVLRNFRRIGDLLEQVSAISFEPGQLAENKGIVDQLFGIIPGSKKKICDDEKLHFRPEPDLSVADKRRQRIAHDTEVISLLPKHFGREHSAAVFNSPYRDNASLFDLLNVFTEYAKEESPERKLGIQQRTGSFAKYVAENSGKF